MYPIDVGFAAFPHASKNGLTIRIAPNISVSGDIVTLKHEAKETS